MQHENRICSAHAVLTAYQDGKVETVWLMFVQALESVAFKSHDHYSLPYAEVRRFICTLSCSTRTSFGPEMAAVIKRCPGQPRAYKSETVDERSDERRTYRDFESPFQARHKRGSCLKPSGGSSPYM